MHSIQLPSIFWVCILLTALISPVISQSATLKKRGLAYIHTDHSAQDNAIFTLSNSPITWYYTYGSNPTSTSALGSLEFVPMIHSPVDSERDIAAVSRRRPEYALVFNEPDGSTDSGGTATSPSDAAKVWHDEIAPLRNDGIKLSLPATTGSPRGLQWLKDFNESCYKLSPERGCEFDFVAAHWYGNAVGLGGWIRTLHEMWPDKGLWVTEFALPAAGDDETEEVLRDAVKMLDQESWVERYAWFGAFRKGDANGWTGAGVSLFDDGGGLTGLGVDYLGGNVTGFREGDKAGNGAGGLRSDPALFCGIVASWVFVVCVI